MTAKTLVVDENEIAEMLCLSVHYMRKDRQNERRIPFFRIGGRIRYSVDRVQQALAGLEEGGNFKGCKRPAPKSDAGSLL